MVEIGISAGYIRLPSENHGAKVSHVQTLATSPAREEGKARREGLRVRRSSGEGVINCLGSGLLQHAGPPGQWLWVWEPQVLLVSHISYQWYMYRSLAAR